MKLAKICFTCLLVIVASVLGYNQNTAIDCSKDSVAYQSLLNFMDGGIYKPSGIERVYYLILYKKRDCFCDLLIYTYIFDYLLRNNVDLNYNFLKNPPMTNSDSDFGPGDSNRKRGNSNNSKFALFRDFLKLKTTFEKEVMNEYEHDKKRSLEQDVNNIIHYHIYAQPVTLRHILLSKNADLLNEKLLKEQEEYFGESLSRPGKN